MPGCTPGPGGALCKESGHRRTGTRSLPPATGRALAQNDVRRQVRELVVPVLGPGLLVVPRVHRPLFAERHHVDPAGVDPVRHQVGLRGRRPAVAEGQVVLLGTPLVAVPGDPDPHRGVGLENRNLLIEERLVRRPDLVPVEIEVHHGGEGRAVLRRLLLERGERVGAVLLFEGGLPPRLLLGPRDRILPGPEHGGRVHHGGRGRLRRRRLVAGDRHEGERHGSGEERRTHGNLLGREVRQRRAPACGCEKRGSWSRAKNLWSVLPATRERFRDFLLQVVKRRVWRGDRAPGWTWPESNRRPVGCKPTALPTELQARAPIIASRRRKRAPHLTGAWRRPARLTSRTPAREASCPAFAERSPRPSRCPSPRRRPSPRLPRRRRPGPRPATS